MFIKLYSGFLSPTLLHQTKEQKERDKYSRIEYKLKKLGFVISGSNFASFECDNLKDISKMMVELRKLGITNGQVCWA